MQQRRMMHARRAGADEVGILLQQYFEGWQIASDDRVRNRFEGRDGRAGLIVSHRVATPHVPQATRRLGACVKGNRSVQQESM
jgi:hypothetical protein